MRSDRFEWDDAKAARNLEKHRISFEKATDVFDDPNAISIPDPEHSFTEDRYVTIGTTFWNETLVVSHTYRDERIRIISARRATKAEQRRIMTDRIEDRDDLLPEYDFSKGTRGQFYQGRGELVIRVSIDPDVAQHYSTTEEVNAALRMLIAEGRAPEPRRE